MRSAHASAVGGRGEVYLANDTQMDRTVALKILPENVPSDRTRLQRFVQEAKSASALNHPNIEGETLRQRLSSARMNLNEVLDVCIQVTNALATAHQAGIIHRDMNREHHDPPGWYRKGARLWSRQTHLARISSC